MCVLHPDGDRPLVVELARSLPRPGGYQAILTHQNMCAVHPDGDHPLVVERACSPPRPGGVSGHPHLSEHVCIASRL